MKNEKLNRPTTEIGLIVRVQLWRGLTNAKAKKCKLQKPSDEYYNSIVISYESY